MQKEVSVVRPEMTLADLESAFIEKKVGGFPVVRGGELVGIVSRSDVVRQLCVEESLAETISDYYRESAGYEPAAGETLEQLSDRVGGRIQHLKVEDCMIRKLFTVSPEQSVQEIAQLLLNHGVHRVLVTEGSRILGIVTTMDLVRVLAEDRRASEQ